MTLQPQRLRIVKTNDSDFPAIFNFGDSNSDTGGKSAAFHRLPSPNGDTFFHKPSGRYSDGFVVLDFLAEKLGLSFLSAYLNSMGTNFRHRANFATGGSTIQPLDARIFEGGFSPISLDIQLLQFEQFKARTEKLYIEGASSYIRNSLPRTEDFSKALYTFDIGQNDLHSGLKLMTVEQLKESVSGIINRLVQAVENKSTFFPGLEDFSKGLYTLDSGQNDLHFWLTSTSEEQAKASVPSIINQFGSTDDDFITLCNCYRNFTKKKQEYFGYIIPAPLAACLSSLMSILHSLKMQTKMAASSLTMWCGSRF
ncbi:hypothetical protein EZV62_017509 [Acer yangbiense]|uniref:Alpha-L-fucosidase n=1 Tax=Acer yangbiense TaxID=1000413 RepID=A0A5C7HJ25_9ROSI|nr:hypothetical protein EZV62_017509 [Acer yangbiense]